LRERRTVDIGSNRHEKSSTPYIFHRNKTELSAENADRWLLSSRPPYFSYLAQLWGLLLDPRWEPNEEPSRLFQVQRTRCEIGCRQSLIGNRTGATSSR
jgi:hypothetical protein